MDECVFVKKKAGRCKLSPWHGDIRKKGHGDHRDLCVYPCVCIWLCENSVLTTTLSHIVEPREVGGSSGLSDKIQLTTKEG